MGAGAVGTTQVEWRRLTTSLWVGIGPDGVVGSIEIGHRCIVTDGAGRVYGRCRRLDDAQALLTELVAEGQAGPLAVAAVGR
jgi:Tfp pilus assembly protein PilP